MAVGCIEFDEAVDGELVDDEAAMDEGVDAGVLLWLCDGLAHRNAMAIPQVVATLDGVRKLGMRIG